ncbi:MAG: HIT domain-containing protein [bacterium]|nr:HIT domain-containing protein [bacterium]
MSELGRLWAGWRADYVASVSAGEDTEGTGFSSPFEAIGRGDRPDTETFVLWRGEHTYAVLNAYPYTTGHLLVVPYIPGAGPDDLDDATWGELWSAVRTAVRALQAAYSPDGVNVGLNLGRAAGAGVPGHLHVHCLPRWAGDTNFMTTVGGVRVLPETLADTWAKLRGVWAPAAG